MALALKILLLVITIFGLTVNPSILIAQSQQVPCVFFFGDSLFDNGNNNNLLLALSKANYPPYGIDYPDGSTGRFSNGRNPPDFLAEYLRFNKSVPSFANARGSDILQGVNYASESAGIRDETGYTSGARFSLNRQIANHRIIRSRISNLLQDPTKVDAYLNKCLYAVYIGNDDYLNNYYMPRLLYPESHRFTPEQFATALIQEYSGQLTTLYNLGARKVAVYGLGLIVGCAPQAVALFPTNGSPCVDFINNDINLFNVKLKPLVDDLNSRLSGARFIYINNTSIYSAPPSTLGFTITNTSCCPVVPTTGLCIPKSVPCADRDKHLWFDNLHPSENFSRASAARSYRAQLPTDAYPVDIESLVQQ